MKALVIGCGSIGKRHIENLLKLGVEVHGFDTNPTLDFHIKNVPIWGKRGYAPNDIDTYIICTPPSEHISSILLGYINDKNLFIEKPVSTDLTGIRVVEWAEEELTVQVGYQMRFIPEFQYIKTTLLPENKTIYASAWFDYSLAKWHPGEKYKKLYTNSPDCGIILDSSHELDYLRWFFGEAKSVQMVYKDTKKLGLSVPDTVEGYIQFEGVLTHIHLGMTSEEYERHLYIKGVNEINWDYNSGLSKNNLYYFYVYRDPYFEEMKQFVACVENGNTPLVTGSEGVKTLRLALACKESAETGKEIKLEPPENDKSHP